MKVASVAEMRTLDAAVIANLGITEEILMENAGIAALRLLLLRQPDLPKKRTLVVCGSGNNGGDGFVLARQIHSVGGAVEVLLTEDKKKCKGAALSNLMALTRIPAIKIHFAISPAGVSHLLEQADIVVDALFGVGLSRSVEGVFAQIINAINRSGKFVLTLDVPSGIDADTGQVLGVAVYANSTVTFGLPKRGLLLFPGFEHCGELALARISFPASYHSSASIDVAIDEYLPLPPRPARAHKKSVGSALFVAGSANYCGAPYLAAASFLRAGGGYARLVTTHSVMPTVAARCPEIVFEPLPEEGGALAFTNLEAILALAKTAPIMVVGSGLSLRGEAMSLTRELIQKTRCPLLIDGDAITALASAPQILAARDGEVIITPHAGEFARLLGISGGDVEANRIEILQSACRKFKAHIVLKGPHSLVGSPDGRVFINLTGNAGMATAGTGDVLTGVIAAIFATGLPLVDALRKAVYLHGLAGDIAREHKGEAGMIASDVLESLPEALIRDSQLGRNSRSLELI